MDKDNKYYGLIEKLVKEHKKFPGYEAIIDDIIDDVYSHSEVIINSIDNASVIQSYLEKVISTSIITVPKKLNFNAGIKHRVISHTPVTSENIEVKKDNTELEQNQVETSVDYNSDSVTDDSLPLAAEEESYSLEETLEENIPQEFTLQDEPLDINLTDISETVQEKANTELVDKMINSIDSVSIQSNVNTEEFDEQGLAEPENNKLSQEMELETVDSIEEYSFNDSDSELDETFENNDIQEFDNVSEDTDITFNETPALSFSDSLEPNVSLEEESENLIEDSDVNEYTTETAGNSTILASGNVEEYSGFTKDDNEPEFEPIDDEEDYSSNVLDTTEPSELQDNDDSENELKEVDEESVQELEETPDLVSTSLDMFETTYKYNEDVENELSETDEDFSNDEAEEIIENTDVNIELEEPEKADNIVDDSVEISDITNDEGDNNELSFFRQESDESETLSLEENEEIILEDNSFENSDELQETSDIEPEYDVLSIDENSIEELSPLNLADDEVISEDLEEGSDIDFSNDENDMELLEPESEITEQTEEDGSEADVQSEFFENIQLVSDYDPQKPKQVNSARHNKPVNLSVFAFEPKEKVETVDTETLSDKLLTLNNDKPELNILNIFEMRYKQNLTIDDIATNMGINKNDVIEALNSMIELV